MLYLGEKVKSIHSSPEKKNLFLKQFSFFHEMFFHIFFLFSSLTTTTTRNRKNIEMSGKVRDIHEKIKIYVYLLFHVEKRELNLNYALVKILIINSRNTRKITKLYSQLNVMEKYFSF